MFLFKWDFSVVKHVAQDNRRHATPGSIRQFLVDCGVALIAYVFVLFGAAYISARFELFRYFD